MTRDDLKINGLNQLDYAVSTNDVVLLREMIPHVLNAEYYGKALINSIENNLEECFGVLILEASDHEKMIRGKYDIDLCMLKGVPAIFSAIKQTNQKYFNKLLSMRCSLNVKDGLSNVIDQATKYNRVDVLQILVDSKCCIVPNNSSMTAFQYACQYNYYQYLQILVNDKDCLNMIDYFANGSAPAIVRAIRANSRECFDIMIGAKCQIDLISPEHSTVLIQAIEEGVHCIEYVQQLICAKCCLDTIDPIHNMTALSLAVHWNSSLYVETLIRSRCNLDERLSIHHDTPFILACREGYTELALMLIEAKCDMNKIGRNNDNALTALTNSNHSDFPNNQQLVKILIGAKCNVNHIGNSLRNALVKSICNQCIVVPILLIDEKCNLDYKNKGVNTALMCAVKYDRRVVANHLIESRCDIYVENDDGENALDIAIKHKNQYMIDLLHKYDDDQSIFKDIREYFF